MYRMSESVTIRKLAKYINIQYYQNVDFVPGLSMRKVLMLMRMDVQREMDRKYKINKVQMIISQNLAH